MTNEASSNEAVTAATNSMSFRHPLALVESHSIGMGTRIWAFAHILPHAKIGEDCNVCDHVFIENDVVIGNRVTLKCGVQLWDGLRVHDDVFIGPNATFTNDPMPRSRQRPESFKVTTISRGASIGANATILPGINIGLGAMVGAGAVVTHDVPPHAIVTGNPARITGYVANAGEGFHLETRRLTTSERTNKANLPALRVPGVAILTMPTVIDLRGALTFGEIGKHLPFAPKRFFVVYDVPGKDVRGEHAHRELDQLLVCIKGSVTVVVDNGTVRDEVILDSPGIGLHLAPMIWGIQYQFSADAVLLVLASDIYRADDYIRDYDEYLSACGL